MGTIAARLNETVGATHSETHKATAVGIQESPET
jgi:hypothetical protein